MESDFVRGQRSAFAAASLMLGVFSFVHLLGMEKAALAILFGYLAWRGGREALGVRSSWPVIGVLLGSLMLITVPVALWLFWPQVHQIVEALEKLS